MSNSKCFCHLGDYEVKDAKARADIEELKESIADLEENGVGTPGQTGADGEDGVTPKLRINSTTNYWEVSYNEGASWSSLNVLATGPQGPTGATGPSGANGKDGEDGADGEDGITPELYIDPETNYWMVSYDESETWHSLDVPATGPAGGARYEQLITILGAYENADDPDGQSANDGFCYKFYRHSTTPSTVGTVTDLTPAAFLHNYVIYLTQKTHLVFDQCFMVKDDIKYPMHTLERNSTGDLRCVCSHYTAGEYNNALRVVQQPSITINGVNYNLSIRFSINGQYEIE